MRNDLQIEYLPIAQIKPYSSELRSHSKKQLRKATKLIQHHGLTAPLILDGDQVIIDGHLRYACARELGFDTLPCIVIHHLEPADIRALRLALNRLPEETRWDQQKLALELSTLVKIDYDFDLTGFEAPEIDLICDLDPPPDNVVEDAPALPEGPAVTKPNDLWLLGSHRVRQGDACNPDHASELMGGLRVRMVFSDPPYNVKICGFVSGLGKAKHREFPIASGELSRTEFVTFLTSYLVVLRTHLVEGAIVYACMDWRHIAELLVAGEAADFSLKNLCVWAKTSAGMGTFYRSQHELVGVFKHGDAEHVNNFQLGQHGRSRTNLWTYRGMTSFGKERDELLTVHPTVKPLQLVVDAIKDVSRRGDIVLDPFLGSGTTLMAAEETGRRCHGMELDPLYVDAAILRWQRKTGRDAILAATGETFDELAEREAKIRATADESSRPHETQDLEPIPVPELTSHD